MLEEIEGWNRIKIPKCSKESVEWNAFEEGLLHGKNFKPERRIKN